SPAFVADIQVSTRLRIASSSFTAIFSGCPALAPSHPRRGRDDPVSGAIAEHTIPVPATARAPGSLAGRWIPASHGGSMPWRGRADACGPDEPSGLVLYRGRRPIGLDGSDARVSCGG